MSHRRRSSRLTIEPSPCRSLPVPASVPVPVCADPAEKQHISTTIVTDGADEQDQRFLGRSVCWGEQRTGRRRHGVTKCSGAPDDAYRRVSHAVLHRAVAILVHGGMFERWGDVSDSSRYGRRDISYRLCGASPPRPHIGR